MPFDEGELTTLELIWIDIFVICILIGPDSKPLVAFVGEGHREILLQFASVAVDYYKSQGKITSEPVGEASKVLLFSYFTISAFMCNLLCVYWTFKCGFESDCVVV